MLSKLKFKRALAEGILDNGESNIFIGDSKFNAFMKDIENLFDDESLTTAPADIESEDIVSVEKPVEANEKETEIKAETGYEDDDIKQTTPKQSESAIAQPELQLLQTASSFFTQLGNVLSDAKSTENLLQSITKKDETTGQTYLQVPVENENVVKNAFTLLVGLFKGISGK